MTSLESLAQRRDLVLMSCDMQRMTLERRLARIEGHRGLAWAATLLRAARLVRSFT